MRTGVLALVALLSAIPAFASDRWREVRDEQNAFSVAFPDPPATRIQRHDDLTIVRHLLSPKSDIETFVVESTRQDPHSPDFQEVVIASSRSPSADELREFRLLSLRVVYVDGIPVRETMSDLQSRGLRVRERIAVFPRLLVRQSWTGLAGGETAPDVERFFASFRFKLKQ